MKVAVIAHAGKSFGGGLPQLDAAGFQQGSGTHAGKLKQLWGIDRPAAEDPKDP
jgi:hypothetical protein